MNDKKGIKCSRTLYLDFFFYPKKGRRDLASPVIALCQPNLNSAFHISSRTQGTLRCRGEFSPGQEEALGSGYVLSNQERCQSLDLIRPWVSVRELVREVFSPDPKEHVKHFRVKGLISHQLCTLCCGGVSRGVEEGALDLQHQFREPYFASQTNRSHQTKTSRVHGIICSEGFKRISP